MGVRGMNEWVKTFEMFLEKADARMKAMRNEIAREVKEEISLTIKPGEPGPRGEKGEPGMHGEKGDPGKDGADGRDGVGIADIKLSDGSLVVRLTDGTEKDLGRVVGPQGERGEPGVNGKDGAAGVDGKDGLPGERGPQGEKGMDGRNGNDGAPGERGPIGEKGMDGKDGAPGRDGRDGTKGDPGRDGKDGITRKELEEEAARMLSRIEVVGRTWKLGEHEVRMPIPEYRGVWRDGEYEAGDIVTWAGSLWHANGSTKDKPGDGDTAWTLIVKRGRDGKDLRSDA
jgi:hypothetical protein